MSIPIVSRKKWNALPPKENKRLTLPAKEITFTFTEENTCITKEECVEELQRLQKLSMDRGQPDIEYNFLIGGDENIYRGRGWRQEVKEGILIVGYLGRKTADINYSWKMVSKGYDLMMYALLNNYAEAVYKRPELDLKITSKETKKLMDKELRNIKI